ncbi:MAG TPA: hypothetical protein VJ975_07315 [Candidatus Limnocylindria bacterium]|nr:hypothetical protein [Candidatus Limnocylindria bacterium]
MIPDWYAWTLFAVVAAAIVAGAAAWLIWPRRSERLPLEHVAGAALIAAGGWQFLVDLPASLVQVFVISSGIPNAPLTSVHVFVIAHAAVVLAATVAILGILRRDVWGAALGIGVSGAMATRTVLGVASLLTMLGPQGMPDGQLAWLVAQSALQAVPPIAAAVLLALPFWRERRRPRPVHAEGIVEVDPNGPLDEAVDLIAPTP